MYLLISELSLISGSFPRWRILFVVTRIKPNIFLKGKKKYLFRKSFILYFIYVLPTLGVLFFTSAAYVVSEKKFFFYRIFQSPSGVSFSLNCLIRETFIVSLYTVSVLTCITIQYVCSVLYCVSFGEYCIAFFILHSVYKTSTSRRLEVLKGLVEQSEQIHEGTLI